MQKLLEKEAEDPKSATDDSNSGNIVNQIMLEENIKMADKLQELETVVEQITKENAQIKCILDIKQNEWIQIEDKGKSYEERSAGVKCIPVKSSNRFDLLAVDEYYEETKPNNEPEFNNAYESPAPDNVEVLKAKESLSVQLKNYRSKQSKTILH